MIAGGTGGRCLVKCELPDLVPSLDMGGWATESAGGQNHGLHVAVAAAAAPVSMAASFDGLHPTKRQTRAATLEPVFVSRAIV
jgi:hypothetical protein